MKKFIIAALCSFVSFSSFAVETTARTGCSDKDLRGTWKMYINHPSRMDKFSLCTIRVRRNNSVVGVCGDTEVKGKLNVSELCYLYGRVAGNDVSAIVPMSDPHLFSGNLRSNNHGRRFVRAKKVH